MQQEGKSRERLGRRRRGGGRPSDLHHLRDPGGDVERPSALPLRGRQGRHRILRHGKVDDTGGGEEVSYDDQGLKLMLKFVC